MAVPQKLYYHTSALNELTHEIEIFLSFYLSATYCILNMWREMLCPHWKPQLNRIAVLYISKLNFFQLILPNMKKELETTYSNQAEDITTNTCVRSMFLTFFLLFITLRKSNSWIPPFVLAPVNSSKSSMNQGRDSNNIKYYIQLYFSIDL